jgi:site-specific DNA-methyltransferase (adenine-specific)
VKFSSDEDAAAAAAAAAQRASHDQNVGRNVYGDFSNGPASLAPYLDRIDLGRWPANVLLDEEAAAQLDAQTGDLSGGPATDYDWRDSGNDNPVHIAHNIKSGVYFGDAGGASRFYYVAKPSREERDFGCEELPRVSAGTITGRKEGSAGLQNPRAGVRAGSMDRDVLERAARNTHPTVKPVELMRWLVKLVTPVNGKVLDPFLGSGTTGMACRYEHRAFVGIEREAAYVEIARRRIAAVAPLFADVDEYLDAALR